jgi:hypothetical protein
MHATTASLKATRAAAVGPADMQVMSVMSMAWHGMAWHGTARHGTARHGKKKGLRVVGTSDLQVGD